MTSINLIRYSYGDQGTTGVFWSKSTKYIIKSLELPPRENQHNISCIPCGIYKAQKYYSKHFGHVFHVLDVPGRTGILIHPGNWAGDVNKKYISNSCGCILGGLSFGVLANQLAILASKIAIRKLLRVAPNEFMLHIIERP